MFSFDTGIIHVQAEYCEKGDCAIITVFAPEGTPECEILQAEKAADRRAAMHGHYKGRNHRRFVNLDAITWPTASSCCVAPHRCVCSGVEKSLRGFIGGDHPTVMTAEQRVWCLNEISQVEGFELGEQLAMPDAALANIVLRSWQESCRMNGTL